MRTTRLLTVSEHALWWGVYQPGGTYPGGVPAWGVPSQGGVPARGVPAQVLSALWTDRHV